MVLSCGAQIFREVKRLRNKVSYICMSLGTAFPTRLHYANADVQSDQSLQGTLWVAKNQKHLQADIRDCDQPA